MQIGAQYLDSSILCTQLDQFSATADYIAFFKELGSGSQFEVPAAPALDDDDSFEHDQQVCL